MGSSTGFSNKEMLEAARKVTGKEIPAKMAPRRAGDPSTLIAASDKARKTLNWQPRFDNVEDIIRTAWNWKQTHPAGYNDRNEEK